jgi:phosphate transport system permease protein
MTAFRQASPASPRASSRGPAGLAEARQRPDRLLFGLPLAVGLLGIGVALTTVLVNATDAVMATLLVLLAVAQGAAVGVRRMRTGVLDRPGLVLAVLPLLAGIVVALLPTWMFGGNVNGIVHRTVISGPLLLVLGLGSVVLSTRRLLSASPSGQDLALVTVFMVPMLLGLLGFVLVLGRIVVSGASTFRLDMITTAWSQIPGTSDYNIGYLNNILGTFLLITLTLVFAILPGVGAGVFMSEYPGRIARVISFCTTMLRAIAIFIIGATAIGFVRLSGGLDSGSFLSLLIRGGWDDGTRVQSQRGSFVLAASFLALLVIPVIARLTEEGLRSVPREIREGSVGLGATDGYNLRRILLPWAAPNILTALILAGAEAAGGLAVIWFMASPGQHGVNLFTNVTDLDFAVFAAKYGPRDYWNSMLQYQDTAALLLLVLTIGLTLVAMVLQRRFARRYRGSITA